MKTPTNRLLIRLENKDPEVRAQAASAFQRAPTKDPSVIAALIRRLKDEDGQVRFFAALALGGIGGKRATKALLVSLEDLAFPNANPAANALGQIGDVAILPHLMTLLGGHPNGRIRRAAVVALALLKDTRAVPSLIERLLGDPDVDVRIEAAIALGYVGDSRALKPLSAVLQNEKDRIIHNAAEEATKAILDAKSTG